MLRTRRLLTSMVGDMAPGADASVRVRLEQLGSTAGVNTAADGSSSPERTLANNIARVRFPAPNRPSSACSVGKKSSGFSRTDELVLRIQPVSIAADHGNPVAASQGTVAS